MDTTETTLTRTRGARTPATRRDLLGAFVAGKRSERTRTEYRRDVEDLARHVEAIRPEDLLGISVADVVRWRDAMEARDLAPSTINRRLSAARTFYRFAVAEGLATRNPAEHVEGPRVEPRASAPWLDNGDARAILEEPDTTTERGKRDRAILELLLRLGLRRAEVRDLTLGDLRREGTGWRLRVKGKGQKVRLLALNGAAEALLDYLEAAGRDLEAEPASAPIFPSPRDPERPLTGNMIYRLVRSYAERARCEVRDGERLAPHGCRRTFATRALDSGVSMEALRRAMGHANPATTARYDRRPDADVVVSY